MIKAIIFDLNGIFITSKLLGNRFTDDFGVPAEKFLPVLNEIMGEVRKPGAKGIFSYWEPHLKEWGVAMSKKEFCDYWFKAEYEVPEMVELVGELKDSGIKIFILSNNFKERAQFYTKHFKFLEMFDKIYYSWQTGYVKTDEMAYRMILNENGLKPEECMFFDDKQKNVEKAGSLGIRSFHFDIVGNLVEDIRKKLPNLC